MKKIFATIIFLIYVACGVVVGQNYFSQKVVASGGGQSSNATYQTSWTIGEAVISTGTGPSYQLTQGFQQRIYPMLVAGSISANQAVCYNTAPAMLTGVAPTGGQTPYTYQWQTSPDNTTWTDIGGANNINYQPPPLTSLTYYRMKQSSAYWNGIVYTNTVTITINPLPTPTITGQNSMCVNSGYYYYSTQSGNFNYTWTISSGGTMTGGQGTATLQVTWNQTGSQYVTVNYQNSFGCWAASPTQFNVTVNPFPGPAGVISGSPAVCAGQTGVSYWVAPISNATSYVWALPAGATITAGQGTANITVSFAANAQSGDITVYGNNSCGNGSVSPPYTVTVEQLPGAAGTISGPATVCQGESGYVYSVDPVTGATSYTWTLPAGATVVGGYNTNVITVSFAANAQSGIITVAGTNSCGNGTVSPNFQVTVNPVPAAPVITILGDVLTSSVATGNQWYYEGTLIPGATGQTYTATLSGWYWCVVIVNGCMSDTSNNIYHIMTGIDPGQSNQYAIYPVPNDGRFHVAISSTDLHKVNISVHNNLGICVYELRDLQVNGQLDKVIDLRPVPSGVYTVVFKNDQGRVIRKIIINN